jgi:phenylacetate-CoA ligase
VADGEEGDFVCTGLTNVDMPLVRYRVGDRGRRAATATGCDCGRTLPLLQAIEGRQDDVLYTVDGRRIGRLDPVFKAGQPIREAQVIQEALDRVRVRYVPAPEFTPEAGRSIIDQLQARMGPIEVILEPIDAVPRTANGKFRAVICDLPADQRRSLGLAA